MPLRTISPVIAIIILVAVTIAIAVAVAGWMMGLWTGFTAKPALSITDAILVVNVTYNNKKCGMLEAVVTNSGQGDADIYSIKIGNQECIFSSSTNEILNANLNSLKGNTSSSCSKSRCLIKAGDTVKLIVNCTKWTNFTPGTSEQIVIFTKDGSKFVGTVQIQSGS